MGINFQSTMMGKKFFEGDIPTLIRTLQEANTLKEDELKLRFREVLALEKNNSIKEKELELKLQEIKLTRQEFDKNGNN